MQTSTHISKVKGHVHAAIITIRQDEYDAVECRLENPVSVDGGNNSYEISKIRSDNVGEIQVALTRCTGQGNSIAQSVASNIITDLDPAWLLLVGIAGGIPEYEFSLGDVILASALNNFSFGGANQGGKRTFQISGGAMHTEVDRFLQTKIVGRNRDRLVELAGFKTQKKFLEHPFLFIPGNPTSHFYGSPDFQEKTNQKINQRFPEGVRVDGVRIWSGPCANGDLVLHDTELLTTWQQVARQIVEVETELAGVYEAARTAGRQNYPILAIRGLSDIVGLKRNPQWTQYACDSAAAFAHAILRSGFIEFSKNLPQPSKHLPVPEFASVSNHGKTEVDSKEEKENFLGKVPEFPEKIMKGKVKRFSDIYGYGFITGENGKDYFVHQTQIDSPGFRTLNNGASVQFTPVSTERGWKANSVKQINGESGTIKVSLSLKENPFIPQDPVVDPKKFAGRNAALFNAIDCIFNNKNLLVTGPRGIGKSSLAYQLVHLAQGDSTLIERIGLDTRGYKFRHVVGDHRCVPGDSILMVARGLLKSIIESQCEFDKQASRTNEFKLETKILSSTKEDENPLAFNELSLEFAFAIEEILRKSPDGTTGICFFIDEVDILQADTPIAPFLKAVTEKLRMDRVSNVSFILAGVTGSTTELITQHPSAGRLTENLPLEPMLPEELAQILENTLEGTGVKISQTAENKIIQLSAKFPAPVQLLGYHSFRLDENNEIDENDVISARDFIVKNLKHQEFQGRLDRLANKTEINILRVLSKPLDVGMKVDSIAKELNEDPSRLSGYFGNLVNAGLLRKDGHLFSIAEPLFKIYLEMFFYDLKIKGE